MIIVSLSGRLKKKSLALLRLSGVRVAIKDEMLKTNFLNRLSGTTNLFPCSLESIYP